MRTGGPKKAEFLHSAIRAWKKVAGGALINAGVISTEKGNRDQPASVENRSVMANDEVCFVSLDRCIR
jgi:hypothetical protein